MIIFVDIDDTICWNISVGGGSIPPDYSNARPYPERIKKINGLAALLAADQHILLQISYA